MAQDEQVTSAVADLYKEYPYPNHGVVSSKIPRMLAPTVRDLQRATGRRRLRLLDAGCGTGENTLGLARAFPELEAVGVDLNQASLERAVALGRKSGIEAAFHRRNLMEPLTDLGTFDLVVSVGVLHHLPAPREGFAQIQRVAAPHARFLGMLYGSYGKWGLFQDRDALLLLAGEESSRAERLRLWKQTDAASETRAVRLLHRLIRRRRFGPPRLPWREAVQRAIKGRGAAADADQLTHTQELVFTWEGVVHLLDETGWEFRGWPPRSGMPDSPEEMFRGEALARMREMPLLEQATIYERLVRPAHLYFLASPRDGSDTASG